MVWCDGDVMQPWLQFVKEPEKRLFILKTTVYCTDVGLLSTLAHSSTGTSSFIRRPQVCCLRITEPTAHLLEGFFFFSGLIVSLCTTATKRHKEEIINGIIFRVLWLSGHF